MATGKVCSEDNDSCINCLQDIDCDDVIECTVDTCNGNTGSCVNSPDDTLCNNGLYCDGVETCDSTNGCQSGNQVSCDDQDDCTIDTCNEDTDTCDNVPDETCESTDPGPGCGCGSTTPNNEMLFLLFFMGVLLVGRRHHITKI